MASRHLDWEGAWNARDLGGLRTIDGRQTRWGAVVRSDELDHLTDSGWEALRAYGVRTIVDLRNDGERGDAVHPVGLTTVHVPLDDVADTAFWEACRRDELDGTPLYYRPFLDRKKERCAAAVAAIADAEPGGVVIHCVGGRDRTGLITMLLLALAGAVPADVVSDYELSNQRLPPFWASRGWVDQRARTEDVLARHHTSVPALLLEILGSLDAGAYLREGGVSDDRLAALRLRIAPTGPRR